MKLIQIFVPVVILHFVVIALVLFMPGCQSRKTPPPPPPGATPVPEAAARTSSGADFVPPAAAPSSRQESGSRVNRHAPMRPVRSEAGSTSELDAAFNANLPLDNPGILRPLTRQDDAGFDDFGTADSTDYSVRSGDTLSGIARRHGVTVAELRSANSLSGDTIRIGQNLRIPSASGGTAAPLSAPVDAAGQERYEVRPGDTLSVIARRHGTTVGQIKATNNLSSDRIVVGQELYLTPSRAGAGSGESSGGRASAPAASRSASGDGSTYVVAPGDNPSTIARRFGVSTSELMQANGIADATRMRVGQVLIIPGGTASASTAAPAPAAPQPSSTPRGSGQARTSAPPPVNQTNAQLRTEPTQPRQIQNRTEPEELLDPADLDALLGDDVPVSPVEVVEPTGEDN